jgi:hypothetical protein
MPSFVHLGLACALSFSLTAQFQVVQTLPHVGETLSEIVGDADHDGRQDVVLSVPSPSGGSLVVFYEDTGHGIFREVYSFPVQLGSSSLLAMGDVDTDGLTDLFFLEWLGTTFMYTWRESSTPDGFPDHNVWAVPKEGITTDIGAVLADSDADGRLEFIFIDASPFVSPMVRIYEAPGPNDPPDALTLKASLSSNGPCGNPVVADFDQDGRPEIVVAVPSSKHFAHFESGADDQWHELPSTPFTGINAYRAAVISQFSPDGRPMLLLLGTDLGGIHVKVFESTAPDTLQLVSDTVVPPMSASLTVADIRGSRVPEIILNSYTGVVSIYQVRHGGVLAPYDMPVVALCSFVAATTQTATESGALVLATLPNPANPRGVTLVLEEL